MSVSEELLELNSQKECLRLEMSNLKRKCKIVAELMAKHKKLLPNYSEQSVKSFLNSAAEVQMSKSLATLKPKQHYKSI